MGARLGFGQPFGQTLQQQAQGRQVGWGSTRQQPLYLAMLDGEDAPPFGFIQLGELIGDAGLLTAQLLFEDVADLVGVKPVQTGIGEAQHAEMLQRAELVNLLDQGIVIVRRGGLWRREVHNGRDQRQQRS